VAIKRLQSKKKKNIAVTVLKRIAKFPEGPNRLTAEWK